MFVIGVTVIDPEIAPPVENPPNPVHDVELVEDHVSVEDPPGVMDVGETDKVAVGPACAKEAVLSNPDRSNNAATEAAPNR